MVAGTQSGLRQRQAIVRLQEERWQGRLHFAATLLLVILLVLVEKGRNEVLSLVFR